MILVLLGAAVIAGVIGDFADTLVIVAIVTLNAIVGFTQEFRAERALAALKAMAPPVVTVIRGGAPHTEPAAHLVPGDVVRVEAGAIVPADLRILESASLRVDEAALTGESVPLTDGLPGLALAAEPAERNVMQRPPRPPGESVFAHGLGAHALVVGLLMAGIALGTEAWAWHTDVAQWQTLVFTTLCFMQLGHVLAIRSERTSLLRQGLLSNTDRRAARRGRRRRGRDLRRRRGREVAAPARRGVGDHAIGGGGLANLVSVCVHRRGAESLT